VFFDPNFFNISTAENRQKAVENHQEAVKIRPTAAPISTKPLRHCHIFEIHTNFQASSSYRSRDIVKLPKKTGYLSRVNDGH
jgi:hypothetical protein